MIIGIIIFFVIFFIVFVVILKKTLMQDSSQAMQSLNKISDDYLKKQDEIKARMDEIKVMYQKKINEAQEEAERIKTETLRQVTEEKEKILAAARQQSEEVIRQGDKTRQNLILDMQNEIKDKAIDLAIDLLGRVLSEDERRAIHAQMVSEFIHEGINQIAALELPAQLKEIKILCAFDMRKEDYQDICNFFKHKLNHDFNLVKEIQDNLLAGLIIFADSIVIDASLKWKIKQRAKDLRGGKE
jgi:F-type H+-transporting ATPase subunit b